MGEQAARRVAFVTGAGSGIGRATAHAFIKAGYAVAFVDRDGAAAAREAAAAGDGAIAVTCDVTDDGAVRAAVDATVAAFGRLDAAFNAAGIDGAAAPLADATMENWNRVLAIDLTGMFSCMRYQIPAMLASGGGAIVNCASTAGITGAPHLTAYCAAKHGVVGLTRGAALDYARQNVRVNAVCPGMIDTPMAASIPPEFLKALLAESPMGRQGKPEEIAAAVLWLCDPSSSFVTGQAIPVDGAWTTR
ncbi:MAG: SDR family oxidoreductase [Sphingomonadales bacterium]|nr:SDR family oxidoreductase [Sphingomonadales bacterium]